MNPLCCSINDAETQSVEEVLFEDAHTRVNNEEPDSVKDLSSVVHRNADGTGNGYQIATESFEARRRRNDFNP